MAGDLSSTSVNLALPPARIREVAGAIAPRVLRTPCVPWPGFVSPVAGELLIKLELLQRTGSFKARGALNSLLSLSDLSSGVVAFSAGNHAIAAAWAARELGAQATVVMPRSANAARVARVKSLGARLLFGDSIGDLLDIVERVRRDEGCALVHPFEGQAVIEGTSTLGLEIVEDAADLDVVYVPIGGGGLIAGVATAIKQLLPSCKVIGVEPEGADGMRQSLLGGAPVEKVLVNTIADSLGAPLHLPLTFSLIQHYVDDVVTVSDTQLRAAMALIFDDMKLAVEPACAASLAAAIAAQDSGSGGNVDRRTLVIACGSNIDSATWSQHMRVHHERQTA